MILLLYFSAILFLLDIETLLAVTSEHEEGVVHKSVDTVNLKCLNTELVQCSDHGPLSGMILFKFQRIGVPTRDLFLSLVLKVCNLSQVEAQY